MSFMWFIPRPLLKPYSTNCNILVCQNISYEVLAKKQKCKSKTIKVVKSGNLLKRLSGPSKLTDDTCVFSTKNTKKPKNNIANTKKLTHTLQANEKISEISYQSVNPRISELNIQMLSASLHKQIFKSDMLCEEPSKEYIDKSISHLQQNGLWNKEPSILPDVDFQLPPLNGKNLKDHFYVLGEQQCEPYKSKLSSFIKVTLPELPPKFEFSEGWTMYCRDGTTKKVDYPLCSALVFDIEVCLSEGKHPTLACAVSEKCWYSWCAPSFINQRKVTEPTVNDLIPFVNKSSSGSINPKVIIGHNVSFDRLAIKDEYYIEENMLRFIDTLSLHIAVSGFVVEQRNIVMKNKKADKKIRLPWMNVGSTNSLKDIFKFYCRMELPKESREIFVKGSLKDVTDNFQELMQYCCHDVLATHHVLKITFPKFLERFPHPITLAGMFEMGKAYLPVSSKWNKYTELSEEKYNELNASLTYELVQQSLDALNLREGEKYKNDPWLWDLDWNLPKAKVKLLQNYPNWYRKLCMRGKDKPYKETPQNMSISLRIVPKLLKLTWNGFPLHFEMDHGWGYLKPITRVKTEDKDDYSENEDNSLFPYESLLLMTESINEKPNLDTESQGIQIRIPNVTFHPLPHKDGEDNKVGNPLSKDFIRKIEDNTLSSAVPHIAKMVLNTSKTISYWKNNRDRILSQIVIPLEQDNLPSAVQDSAEYSRDEQYGAILPLVVTAGTITRRAVDRTWMTASNAYSDRIGSELKGIIEAPPGYHFVGADVDSQELWIASILGDAYFSGIHGSTALGWMTLQGSKAQGTDMHSITAKTAGISRDNAKVINYGRIYGAGLYFMQRLLKQFNPSLSHEEAKQKAVKLFAATKGQKGWLLNSEGRALAEDVGVHYTGEPIPKKQISRLLMRSARRIGTASSIYDVITGGPLWVGGSESHMFNCLEAIACMDKPRTPVLGARITRALEPWCVDDQFMTSRVNWVVQSSAVDYLHLMLVSMRWLFSEFKIKGRFSISIHDEYLAQWFQTAVPRKLLYRAVKRQRQL